MLTVLGVGVVLQVVRRLLAELEEADQLDLSLDEQLALTVQPPNLDETMALLGAGGSVNGAKKYTPT